MEDFTKIKIGIVALLVLVMFGLIVRLWYDISTAEVTHFRCWDVGSDRPLHCEVDK